METDVRLSDDDDDDIDESAIPAFSHPTMRPNTPPLNKGKSRAPEQLALPTTSAPPNQPSGNIGTPIGGTSRGVRRDIGGIRVESRSRIYVPFTPWRETYPLLGPAGLLPSTNRSPPPSFVNFLARSTCVLTVNQVRDLRSIYHKLIQVLYPPRQGQNREVLR